MEIFIWVLVIVGAAVLVFICRGTSKGLRAIKQQEFDSELEEIRRDELRRRR